jgi:exonuclease SbcC
VILSTLELENYRQYRSERIEFPERGIVGVIGANGVGKTTLFEAIEWCLFAPRTIGNSDVPPRGIPGATKVTLTLFDPRDGASWVIERGLTKSGLKTAEIYRADNPAAPVVQGTGPVTRYIENRLIGLSHLAFESTSFTRQT